MLKRIRLFFEQKSVLEVETPLLCHATGTDPQLDFFSSLYHWNPSDKDSYKKVSKDNTFFLQTSPEFAMKRLLASGSGSIFQICKAFRNGEIGRFHNPEFSILEWYRIDFSLQQLMAETTEILTVLLKGNDCLESIYEISYVELFVQVTQLDPLVFCQCSYEKYAANNGLNDAPSVCVDDHSMWLDFIFNHKIQPFLEKKGVCMVYGYPAIQSSLARINRQNAALADRFEVFINGIEIGNGFFELADAKEQEKRFDRENKIRELMKREQVMKDQRFLQALDSGLPDCSGIAIGLDRLLMIIAGEASLKHVVAFPFDRA